MSPKRFAAAACQPPDLPALDAVFIIHDHHDHLSYPSVKELVRVHPRVQFFVGVGLAKWFRDGGIHAVTEMDWWDDADVNSERTASEVVGSDSAAAQAATVDPERISVRISCLPSQHGSMRSPLEKDRSLWASWAVASGAKPVWFAGDTGYRCVPEGIEELGPGFDELPRNPQFSQIGTPRGPFDLGIDTHRRISTSLYVQPGARDSLQSRRDFPRYKV